MDKKTLKAHTIVNLLFIVTGFSEQKTALVQLEVSQILTFWVSSKGGWYFPITKKL